MPRPEKPLAAADTVLGRFAADLRRMREKAGGPTYRELSRSAHFSVTALSEAAGGRRLPTLAVTLAYVSACDGDLEQWRDRWHATAAELADAAEPDPADGPETGHCPYVGLTAFQASDADRFFGRERIVDDLVARVGRRRFLAVFGASGSGKSSVLRAGLVARSTAAGTPVLVFTPGPRPLEECAVRLAEFTGEAAPALHTELSADPGSLHLRVRQALLTQRAEGDLLLVVDQFEEVFTLCHDEAERAGFIQALLSAAAAPTSRVRVALGVRADFYGHCGQYPELAEALRDGQILISPMTAKELRQAITAPASGAGYVVETALVSQLVSDAAGQPAVLPLLSHVLRETWGRRRGTRLTLSGYEETGGIEHALARSAEQVYCGFDGPQQAAARQIFLRLTALGEGTEDTKRRIDRSELADTADTALVLETLARARLLTLDRDGVEIAHEAVIRHWPRLRSWLTEDRDGLRLHRQLTEATGAWESLDHDLGTLYRGNRLALIQDWATTHQDSLTGRERRFLEASLRAEAAEQATTRRRTRRLRQLVALLTVLLLTAATSVVLALGAEQTATNQRNIAIARQAATDAAALRESNSALSAQLGLAAYRLAATPETRDNLMSTFSTPYASKFVGHTGDLVSLAFAPDSQVVATASWDHTARLWDMRDVHQPRQLAVLSLPDRLRSVAFAPVGHLLATSTDTGVQLWDVADPRQPRGLVSLPGPPVSSNSVAFSPNGRTMAVAYVDGTAHLWNVDDPRHPRDEATLRGHTAEVNSVVFSHDGRLLATTGDMTARLWDVTDPVVPQPRGVLIGHTDIVSSAEFSPDDHTLATSGWDHTVRLWDIATPAAPRPTATLTGHPTIAWSVAFSPDGRTLASTGGTTILWDLADLRHPRRMTTLPGGVYTVAFSPDGNTLATADWVQDLRDLSLIGHEDVVSTVAFSPDGRVLATGSWDRTVRLWEVTDQHGGRLLATLTGQSRFVRSVSFSPDGHTLASSSEDGTVWLWNVTDPRAPRRLAVISPGALEAGSAAFSPDGRVLAVGGLRVATLWDLTDLTDPHLITRLDGEQGSVYPVVFSPDGRTLVTGSDGTGGKWWDVTDPRHPRDLHSPLTVPGISAGAFSPDNRTLAMVDTTKKLVRLVDVTDPNHPRTLAEMSTGTGTAYNVAFSRDGRELAAGADDKTARLWEVGDPAHPQDLAVFTGHTDVVPAVAFSPDGRTLVTGSNDKTARFWETDIDQVGARICAVAYPRITPQQWDRYFPALDFDPPCR